MMLSGQEANKVAVAPSVHAFTPSESTAEEIV